MQLVYVERATADTDDIRLDLILKSRAKAAERCVEANQHAVQVKADLIMHLARRLREGATREALRKVMQDSGIAPGVVTALLDAARGTMHG